MELENLPYGLQTQTTYGAQVALIEPGCWRLSIPEGPAGRYRLAQVDNTRAMKRSLFPYKAPWKMRLKARASKSDLPGTWGFGVWNDPFGMAILTGKGVRLPQLPNAAWFFHASPQNYLSLWDDQPANGWLGATFRSPLLPSLLLMTAAPLLALMVLPAAARLMRSMGRRHIQQSAIQLDLDPVGWHEFLLDWKTGAVILSVDGEILLKTAVSPLGRLGMVIWIDNQYAAFPPDGRVRYGLLANPEPAWIEIQSLNLEPESRA